MSVSLYVSHTRSLSVGTSVHPSPTGGHLGCSQVLTVMNKVVVNIHVQLLCGQALSARLGKIPGSTIVGSYG